MIVAETIGYVDNTVAIAGDLGKSRGVQRLAKRRAVVSSALIME